MSIGFAFDAKEQVREATDIVELVGSYLQLRRQGRNFVALCPWHDDRRPSLQINQDRQTWKCWVCNDGGDAFSFVMKKEGIDFREAIEMLADRANIEVHTLDHGARAAAGNGDDKTTLYQAMAWAQSQYHECLMQSQQGEPARRYLEQRGLSAASLERYQLGFAPNSWQWLIDRARTTPHSESLLQRAGLIASSSRSGKMYDFFRGRVMFPIRDPQKRTIAFGGRVLPEFADDRSGKYVNTSETRLFSKSDHLYGLDVAADAIRRKNEVMVVEGYTDVIMANQYELENVVAVLGTALTSRHTRLLRRYAEQITLVLDGDDAGQRRTNEILELFVAEQIDLRILRLPDGLDPCDFLQSEGAAAYRQLNDQSVNALDHKIQIETAGLDLIGDPHRAHQALERILATLARAPRLQTHTDTSMRMREHTVLNRLARKFRINESEIRERLTAMRRSVLSKTKAVNQVLRNTNDPALIDPRERELLEILVHEPDVAGSATQAIPVAQLQLGPLREIYAAYCQLVAEGMQPSFDRMLTHLEEPELKNWLVEIDEQAQRKAATTSVAVEQRLKEIIQSFQVKTEEEKRRQIVPRLDDKNLNEQKEEEILLELLQNKKNRLGIS